ncbi:MAG: stage III sporulation protein AD [Clostridia bacterium]|nr:stage III sporulation protein AD [Clostridia bacterium]
MELFVDLCGVAITASGAALVLRKNADLMATLLSVALCVAAGAFALHLLSPVLTFLEQLQALSGLSETMVAPLLKTVAVGFLTKITASVCRDASQTAAADAVELGGSILALYLALPLLNAVLALLRELLTL